MEEGEGQKFCGAVGGRVVVKPHCGEDICPFLRVVGTEDMM